MAYIEDRDGKQITFDGPTEYHLATMVNAQMKNALMQPKDKRRYAEGVVRAAIRRSGYTDAGQRLVLSDTERKQWERDNSLDD